MWETRWRHWREMLSTAMGSVQEDENLGDKTWSLVLTMLCFRWSWTIQAVTVCQKSSWRCTVERQGRIEFCQHRGYIESLGTWRGHLERQQDRCVGDQDFLKTLRLELEVVFQMDEFKIWLTFTWADVVLAMLMLKEINDPYLHWSFSVVIGSFVLSQCHYSATPKMWHDCFFYFHTLLSLLLISYFQIVLMELLPFFHSHMQPDPTNWLKKLYTLQIYSFGILKLKENSRALSTSTSCTVA